MLKTMYIIRLSITFFRLLNEAVVSSDSNSCFQDVAAGLVWFVLSFFPHLFLRSLPIIMWINSLCIFFFLFFLTLRDNGITSPSAQGQHWLLSGFAEEVEWWRQDGERLLLPLQHLVSPGHGDAGGQRQHSSSDVRGKATGAQVFFLNTSLV